MINADRHIMVCYIRNLDLKKCRHILLKYKVTKLNKLQSYIQVF